MNTHVSSTVGQQGINAKRQKLSWNQLFLVDDKKYIMRVENLWYRFVLISTRSISIQYQKYQNLVVRWMDDGRECWNHVSKREWELYLYKLIYEDF